jgi:cobalamin synthase
MRWGRHFNPMGATVEDREVRFSRMTEMRKRGGGSAASYRSRSIVAWTVVAIAVLLMAYAVSSQLGLVAAGVFIVLALAMILWLYRQFRSYG